MIGIRRWLGTGFMLVWALQASAAIQPMTVDRSAAAVGTTSRLTVFGIAQPASSSPIPVSPGKLDGTLTAVAQNYPTISAAGHQIQSLHTLNPAARFRLSTP